MCSTARQPALAPLVLPVNQLQVIDLDFINENMLPKLHNSQAAV